MPRRFVNQLGGQEALDQVFLAAQKQLRPNRNGNLYLQVELSDRTGSVSARMWNASEADYRSFDDGDFVRVEGSTQVFQGAVQVIANQIMRVTSEEVDPADFMPLSPAQIDELVGQFTAKMRSLRNPHLRNLAECFLLDEELFRKFTRAPAGVKNHHAYLGGLLEHVVSLMTVADLVAPCYPALDRDLLIVGAFLHDLGKVDELTYERGFAYSDEGQLVGHVVMGVSLLEQKIREAEKLSGEPIPPELVLRLKHLIVSHHGEYEFGSPKLPMTLEAVALHLLDNLDAKLHALKQLLRDDPNKDSAWTTYHAAMSRKFYKGPADSEQRQQLQSRP